MKTNTNLESAPIWTEPSDQESPRAQLDRVLAALGTRRFLRSPLVRSRDLELAVGSVVAETRPISMLLLWGKGKKSEPDLAESRAADFLGEFAERVSRAWSPGIHYVVLFADTHAAINGHDQLPTWRYFRAVQRILEPLGAGFGTLSALRRSAGITAEDVFGVASTLDARELRELTPGLDLVAAARRHVVSGDPVWAARCYCAARILEGQALSSTFSGFLFANSDPPERGRLQPQLPLLPLRSWARRCAKPWNVELPEANSLIHRKG